MVLLPPLPLSPPSSAPIWPWPQGAAAVPPSASGGRPGHLQSLLPCGVTMLSHPCLGVPVADSTAPNPILFSWSGDGRGTSQLCPPLCPGRVARALSVQWGHASWSLSLAGPAAHLVIPRRDTGPGVLGARLGRRGAHVLMTGWENSAHHQPGWPMGEARVGGLPSRRSWPCPGRPGPGGHLWPLPLGAPGGCAPPPSASLPTAGETAPEDCTPVLRPG